jgi:polysaccharide pyruvyl transferase WcaK-like protein
MTNSEFRNTQPENTGNNFNGQENITRKESNTMASKIYLNSDNQSSSQKTILLLGTHGQDNWGDEILLETFLQSLGQNNKYLINSYNPQQTLERFSKNFKGNFDIEVFHTTKEIFKLPLRIWKSDVVFFAGGSILKELYASYGRWIYSTLFMILGIVSFANLIAQKTIVTSNIGVGPVKTKFGKFLVKLILAQVNIISLRDEASKKIVLESGILEKRVVVVPDIVFIRNSENFGISNQTEDKRLTNLSSNKATLKIGLNLNKDIAVPEMWPSLLENVSLALNNLKENKGGTDQEIEIVGIPMQIGFNNHHDLLILNEFAENNPYLNLKVEVPQSSTELAKLIRSCDFIIAERLHAIIIATVLNVPAIPLMYDPKVVSLAKYLGLEDFAIDVNKPFEWDQINKKISLLQNYFAETKLHIQQQYLNLNQQNNSYFDQLKNKLGL